LPFLASRAISSSINPVVATQSGRAFVRRSPDEQARYSELAAIALHNTKPDGGVGRAGRASERRSQGIAAELQDVLDRFDEDKRRLPKRSFGFKAIALHAIE